mgnify:CR=1 FL=1
MVCIRAFVGVAALAILAGSTAAQVTSIDGLNVRVRNFNDFPGSTLEVNNVAQPTMMPQPTFAIGNLNGVTVEETFAQGTVGNFANRHLPSFSNDGGATAYQLQNNQSFRLDACFRLTTNHTTGIGAPVNSETGFWFESPRTGRDANGALVNFVDEGGLWLISNGTSFTGGSGMDFFLYGEGGFPNPGSPPIVGNGDLINATYTYYAPGTTNFGPTAFYEATVTNTVTGVTRSSGFRQFFDDAVGMNGFGNGTTFGFRTQNSRQPNIETVTVTEIDCISIVPAPSTLAALGLVGLLGARRRR